MRRLLAVVPLFAAALSAQAPSQTAVPAAIKAIKESDLKRDLFALAGDDMRGREAGTLDEMRASMWVADELEKIGVQPAGEMGSWFQWWNMRRTRISTNASGVWIASQRWALWTEITPTSNVARDVEGKTLWVDDITDTTVNVRDQVVVTRLLPPNATAIRSTTNTPDYNYTRASLARYNQLNRRGAAAVIVIADSVADRAFDGIAKVQARGTYDVVGGVPRFSRNQNQQPQPNAAPSVAFLPMPVLLVRSSALPRLRNSQQMVAIQIRSEQYESPSTNIIGVVRGTDAALRDEYVVFSSHQDHDGVRYAVDGDSIWNGADDNATTSVALLAIARAWKQQPSKRSALFIYHGAEERGLLGSRYYVAHPIVPLEKLVAVLNGDMIGRNHPDTAALLGSQPPHRNSTTLVQMAIDANKLTGKFVIDSLWDRPNHPEGWYFRSDHVPYAERNVPALFFSSNLHGDYHTPRDEPKNIDYAKLTRITQWMYMTGWLAANAKVRPAIDPGFVLR